MIGKKKTTRRSAGGCFLYRMGVGLHACMFLHLSFESNNFPRVGERVLVRRTSPLLASSVTSFFSFNLFHKVVSQPRLQSACPRRSTNSSHLPECLPRLCESLPLSTRDAVPCRAVPWPQPRPASGESLGRPRRPGRGEESVADRQPVPDRASRGYRIRSTAALGDASETDPAGSSIWRRPRNFQLAARRPGEGSQRYTGHTSITLDTSD